MNAAKTLVQAFISCRLDYCNSLLFILAVNERVAPRRGAENITEGTGRNFADIMVRNSIAPSTCVNIKEAKSTD